MPATSGTPTISESYAVLGDERRPGSRRTAFDTALVLLPRGPARFRPALLAEWWSRGFPEIVAIEPRPLQYEPFPLVQALPGLRLLVGDARTPGGWINAASREVRSDSFLVLWDDQTLPEGFAALRVPRLVSSTLLLAPVLREPEGRPVPCVQVLGLEGERLKVLALTTDEESVDTLFPADFSGLYHRERFLTTGGFDADLKSPFWQGLEWGLRSHLWGETLQVQRGFVVAYRLTAPVADQTADAHSTVVYLRHLAVRHSGDHGELPWSRFWRHWSRSGLPLIPALRQFARERAWVKKHRYRYKTDARLLAELWGVA